MAGELKDHITKNISRYYSRQILWPALFLVFIVVMSFIFPIRSLLLPRSFGPKGSVASCYERGDRYVSVTLEDLYFTGYRKILFGKTIGYYYYTMFGDKCTLLLLTGDTCDQGNPTLETAAFDAKIVRISTSENRLLTLLAKDLSWTATGITENISPYVISEPPAASLTALLLKILFIACLVYASFSLVMNIFYTLLPKLAPPVQKLRSYGNPRRLLAEAEDELSTLPQLATEDMYITQHFFIETSSYGIAIVPIDEIIWIYKYSTLHRFFWHVSAISYTLYITTAHHQVIRCPKNIKSDIDGIMDYLAEANHRILVGFNEKNREAARAMQEDPPFLSKVKALLSSRL